MDYATTAKTALAAIQRFGRLLTITRLTPTFDNLTGEPALDAITELPVVTTLTGTLNCLVLPHYKGARNMESMDDTLKAAVVAGRAKSAIVAAAGLTLTPAPGDTLSIDGSDWQVLGVNELNPAGIPLLYTLGLLQV